MLLSFFSLVFCVTQQGFGGTPNDHNTLPSSGSQSPQNGSFAPNLVNPPPPAEQSTSSFLDGVAKDFANAAQTGTLPNF